MTQSSATDSKAPLFLSEIFPLTVTQPKLTSFRLTPEIDRELGNRLSWRLCDFSAEFPDLVVIWQDGYFYGFVKPDRPFPSAEQWKTRLEEIVEPLKSEIGDRYYSFQWVKNSPPTASILSQLAVRILKLEKSFTPRSIWSKDRVEVRREVDFWAEEIELNGDRTPALTLTIRSRFCFQGNLDEFYENHPYRHEPKELLVGLKVRDRERGSSATIVDLAGKIGDRRDELLAKATGAISQQSLLEAPEDQPIVSVRFGRDRRLFDYPLAALIPRVTEETADRYNIQYGELLKAAKISYAERQENLVSAKESASRTLNRYGFQVRSSINSRNPSDLFLDANVNLAEVPLLFGKNRAYPRNQVLKGLSEGGVYRRYWKDRDRSIRISVLKVGNFKVQGALLKEIDRRLQRYGFTSLPPTIHTVEVDDSSIISHRVEVERKVEEMMAIPTDIVLTFLPQSDRDADSQEGGSFYTLISSLLLRREIASQVIYERTAKDTGNYGHILNQVIPGVLAKLGNLPFILAEPLEIADCFIGLDISRVSRRRGSGSQNVCASVRLYGKQGEFKGYRLEDARTEGEEIDKQTLERFLPAAEHGDRTTLIYRDGRFCGEEIQHLREREKAIGARFILVECIKSGIPRLYSLQDGKIAVPPKGLALRLSSREVLLVTTEIKSDKVGVPEPLRLRIVPEEGHQVSLESLVEATLKLTLLHHGSLKEPRLPIPLYGSDRIAYRRLQGISPRGTEGDRQFWL